MWLLGVVWVSFVWVLIGVVWFVMVRLWVLLGGEFVIVSDCLLVMVDLLFYDIEMLVWVCFVISFRNGKRNMGCDMWCSMCLFGCVSKVWLDKCVFCVKV